LAEGEGHARDVNQRAAHEAEELLAAAGRRPLAARLQHAHVAGLFLAARLQGDGLRVAEEGRALLIAFDDDHAYDLIRDGVAALGLGLVRVEQRRQQLEDIFREPAGV